MPETTTIINSPPALARFNSDHPVSFKLYDDEGRQHIYILNDQSPGRTHHLVLSNTSGQTLRVQPAGGNHLPGPMNYHFELRFRPGALDPEFISWLSIGTGGWRMAVEEQFDPQDGIHDGTVSVYLLFTGAEELVLRPGRAIVLLFDHLKAALPGGSRGSRMELRYHTDGMELLTAPAADLLHFRQERLQIINQRGIKDLPMMAGFEGSSTVLNDGTTDNHLVLQISNFLYNSVIPLHARDSESPTKFILSFDTSEEHAAWALCDADNAAAIDVEMHFKDDEGAQWHIRPEFQGNNPQWTITLIEDIDLQVGEYFHLHLEGLKTSMPSGFTNLYLIYENIPGFWDGRFELRIEKSPIKLRDLKTDTNHRKDGRFIQRSHVGIGNVEPQETLDVNGGVLADKLVLRNANPEPGRVPLEVNGKIKAAELELSGKVITTSSATESLDVAQKLTLGSVAITEKDGAVQIAGRLKDSTGFVIPPGGIIMWSGAIVPEGWALCDGSNGTPDLRSRFIVGAGQGTGNDDRGERLTNYPLNQGGGRQKHALATPELPAHNHSASSGNAGSHRHQIPIDNGGGGQSANTPMLWFTGLRGERKYTINALADEFAITQNDGSHQHPVSVSNTGNNQPHENRPPYFALAFIMKK